MAPRDYRPLPQRVSRKGWSHEQSAVECELRYWGARYRRILLSEGFSAFSPFAGILEGRTQRFDSRVLIPDMTPRAWRTNRDVWALPLDNAWALVARYAAPDRDDKGRLYTSLDFAAALGCSAEVYRYRVSRGRKLLRLLMFSSLPASQS